MVDDKFERISLDQIKVQKHNVRIHDIDHGKVKRGGSSEDIIKRAKTRIKSKLQIELSSESAEKLHKVVESNGETKKLQTTQYLVDGVDKDYDQLGD